MKSIVAGIVGAALLLGACTRSRENAQEREVRSAVETHLKNKSNLALNSMDMQIQNVKVMGDTADAQVRFSSKQNPQLAVNIQYALRRAGDHWEVVSSSPMGGMGGDSHQSMNSPAQNQSTPSGSQPAQPEASH